MQTMAKSKGTMAETAYKGVYNTLRNLVHLTAFVQFSYAIYYDYTYVHFPPGANIMHNPFGGKFKYLTFLDAVCIADKMAMPKIPGAGQQKLLNKSCKDNE